jgi:predicted transcriptional regulator
MTSSTTLKLPDALKERIAPLARSAGKTSHAWMIEALEAQAELAELRRAFLDDALAAAADIDAGGPLYAMEDVHAYIAVRAAGRKVPRPKALPAETRGRRLRSSGRH